MHSIFQQIKALYLAIGFSVGYTFKEFATWVVRAYRARRDRRKDNLITDYLVREWIANPPFNKEGSVSFPYRSTIQIAKTVGMSAVEVSARLIRLEEVSRVERPGTQSEVWIPTNYELHDWERRTKQRLPP